MSKAKIRIRFTLKGTPTLARDCMECNKIRSYKYYKTKYTTQKETTHDINK